MFGLVVSPVSWSHHWVWALPTVVVCSVVAYRHRNMALGAVTAAGVALMVWTPITLMPEHHETRRRCGANWSGGSYVWWALAVIVVAGTDRGAARCQPRRRLRRDRCRRLGRRQRALRTGVATLLEVGGVQVDVLLTGQLHQFVDHLVDDRPLDEPVAGQALEPAEVHRLAEPHRDPAEPPHLGAGRVDLVGADHRDRDDRDTGLAAPAGPGPSCPCTAGRRASGCPRGTCRAACPRSGCAPRCPVRPERSRRRCGRSAPARPTV